MKCLSLGNLFRGVALATALLLSQWPPRSVQAEGEIVVANRGSGTISVIDVRSCELTATVDLPAGERPPEPMYVVYGKRGHRVWVGDRANNRVVVFDADVFEPIRSVPCGAGVFHMWADGHGEELWVVNDVDRTATVIDMRRMEGVATVPMPQDLSDRGARPHDVVLDRQGDFAYVTLINVDPAFDAVVQFSTRTRKEVNRVQVGKDPHVSYNHRTDEVYSPCQNGNAVFVLDALTLEINDVLPIPGAHGAATSRDGKRFYTTNLPGLGQNALFGIRTSDNQVVSGPANTPYTVPHNLTLTPSGRTLFVTHSGPNNKVTVFSTCRDELELIGEVTVGMNPFGLAHVP